MEAKVIKSSFSLSFSLSLFSLSLLYSSFPLSFSLPSLFPSLFPSLSFLFPSLSPSLFRPLSPSIFLLLGLALLNIEKKSSLLTGENWFLRGPLGCIARGIMVEYWQTICRGYGRGGGGGGRERWRRLRKSGERIDWLSISSLKKSFFLKIFLQLNNLL